MARFVSLTAIVGGFPDTISTVECILKTQRATGVLNGTEKLSPKSTFTWSEIYLELLYQGFRECLVTTGGGQVPGYKR